MGNRVEVIRLLDEEAAFPSLKKIRIKKVKDTYTVIKLEGLQLPLLTP